MKNIFFKISSLVLVSTLSAYPKSVDTKDNCPWCVFKSESLIEEIKNLTKKSPEEQLKSIREQGVCIMVMESGRRTPKDFFTWGKIETPKESLLKISKVKNLMGKTLCKGEHDLARKCITIALASDAPKSTLIHEYLHAKQIQNDPEWCRLSKQLWKRSPTADEVKIIRNKEWDVHRFLWESRESLNFNIEDELAITAETIEEAEQRKSFDSTASEYAKDQKLNLTLNQLIQKYKKAILAN